VDNPVVSREADVVWYLSLNQSQIDGVALLAAEGRLSNRTTPDLERALSGAIDSAVRGVVLDLSAVDYISSAGFRTLESAAARLAAGGRALVVCGLQDAVSVAFALAGVSAQVVIEPSRDLAVVKATGT
jgi:anti-anti-sigma factor